MKKLALISSVIALAGVSAFGQFAAVTFGTSKSTTWDGFTTSPASRTANVDVGLLWGPSGDTPAIDTLTGWTATPTANTNGTPVSWGGATPTAAAWTAILSDPNFTLAYQSTAGSAPYSLFSETTASSGSTATATFGLANSSGVNAVIGTTYTMFLISWQAIYANPAAAQAAGSAVGWGQPFTYTTFNSTGTGPAISGYGQFGTSTLAPIPEPATLALSALGGLSLLLLRRRS